MECPFVGRQDRVQNDEMHALVVEAVILGAVKLAPILAEVEVIVVFAHDAMQLGREVRENLATVVELKSQCGVGRWTDDVLGLMDVRQGMRVGAGRRNSRRTSSGSCRGLVNLTRGGMRLHGKGTQPGRALSPSRELTDALDRRTGT